MPERPAAVSLFSSAGIGDLAARAAGFEVLVSAELLAERHALFGANFPDAVRVGGDLWETGPRVAAAAAAALAGRPLDLLFATPPCQGMSKNGRGKLLNAVRAGRRPALDPRNELVRPVAELAKRLRPVTLLMENVPEMRDTVILDGRGEAVLILDFLRRALGPDYACAAEVVEFADYGVPQRRRRLITTLTRDPRLRAELASAGTLLPPPTHAADPSDGRRPWVTVEAALAGVPPLDAGDPAAADSPIPFHRVPLLDARKYWWVANTPPNAGAFDNQCAECGFEGNPAHSAARGADGVNRASRETPLDCRECGAALPRPSVEGPDGARRLMRGFTSAYKRMRGDLPASTLTRNLSYACSDNKLHPTQNRVLSLYEAFRLHTLDRYEYRWERADGRRVSDKTVREVIGESVPPAGLQALLDHLRAVRGGAVRSPPDAALGGLFAAPRAAAAWGRPPAA